MMTWFDEAVHAFAEEHESKQFAIHPFSMFENMLNLDIYIKPVIAIDFIQISILKLT